MEVSTLEDIDINNEDARMVVLESHHPYEKALQAIEDTLADNPDGGSELPPLPYSPTSFRTYGWPSFHVSDLSHVVVIAVLVMAVSLMSPDDGFRPWAVQSVVVSGLNQTVECGKEYFKAINRGLCHINECKRYVSDEVITHEEADSLLAIFKKALKITSSSGGSSILNLYDGRLSNGDHYLLIYRRQHLMNLFTDKDFQVFEAVNKKIREALTTHLGVDEVVIEPVCLYPSPTGYFSALTAKPPVTIDDRYWIPQIDHVKSPKTHFSAIICLNNFNIDFTGGRFTFIDSTNQANRTVEPRKGRVIMFTSGEENYNFIEKVTSGTRYALNIPFTCDEMGERAPQPGLHRFLQ